MTDRPTIGKAGKTDVSINVPELLASRAFVCAQSGAGKSWLLRRLAEQTFGQVQHIILDPEGEFYTLREKHPYVLAGDGRDCPAHPGCAKQLATSLLELGASAVVDIYELDLEERREFVRDFLTALVRSPKKLWRPLLVFLDEAQDFAPQNGSSCAADAVSALMNQGRKRGFAGILATQRIAKVDKNAVAACGTKLIGRTSLKLDVTRSVDELGFARGDAPQLQALKRGEFLAYGPAFGGDGVVKMKVGGVETSHPRPGDLNPPTAPRPDELAAAFDALSEIDDRAKAEAQTLEELEAEVKRLNAEVRRLEKGRPVGFSAEQLEAARLEERERCRSLVAPIAQRLAAEVGNLEEDWAFPTETVLSGRAVVVDPGAPVAPPPRSRSAPVAAPPTPAPIDRTSNGDALAPAHRRMLIAIASYHPDSCPLDRAKLLANVSARSSTASVALSKLRKQGLIDGGSDALRATPAGVEYLGPDYEPLPVGDALRELWRGRLSGSKRDVFDYICAAHPNTITVDEACDLAGISRTSSTRSVAISEINRLGLIDRPSRGVVRAKDELFG